MNKPQISILLATYNPNPDWLREQLLSLNAQDYPNLRLYIRDDASDPEKAQLVRKLAAECITAFPFSLSSNGENLGSNKTFALLTQEAEGDYFAYCDQDDIWQRHKLSTLQSRLEENGALLVCSDMQIIGTDGEKKADSITDVRRHHVFRSGAGLAEGLLTHNFVTGCTMLLRAETAKAALPFCPYMVHDHYLALFCAERGEILTVREPLVQYRLHGGNQTELLHGVSGKADYGEIRIETLQKRFRWLRENFPCCAETKRAIREASLWADARYENWHHLGGKALLWKYRRFSPLTSTLELFGGALPEKAFHSALKAARKNRI